MRETGIMLLSDLAAFMVTNMDTLVLMGVLYAIAETKNRSKELTVGMILGTCIIVGASFSGALLTYDLPDIVLKSLGALPIVFGALALRHMFERRGVEEEFQSYIGRYEQRAGVFSVLLITLAIGGDNVAVYIPLLAGRKMWLIIESALMFVGLGFVWCYISHALRHHPFLVGTMGRIRHLLFPLAMVAMGIWIFIR